MDYNWYAFFVRSGQEAKAADEIKTYFSDKIETRILSVEVFFKKHRIMKKERRVVFPGYVFVMSGLDNEMFINQCRGLIFHSNLIYKILCYGNTRQAALNEKDVELLEKIWSGQSCLKASVGIMEGDMIRIMEGPFVGQESMIRKVNRHKRQAVVEIDFMGEVRLITIGLDIIRKDESG